MGTLKLVVDEGKITAINILPAEDYLISVISSEMNATSSLEFLKAHAVVSRSWLFAQIEKRKALSGKNEGFFSFIKDRYRIYPLVRPGRPHHIRRLCR